MLNQTRENTIKKLLIKYDKEPAHAEHVTKLALIFFDKTREIIHSLSDNDRDLLEAGALLHDIGYHISAKGHNKNSYKLIEQENMQGFSEREKEIIGNITRYHRGKLPKEKHTKYFRLPGEDRRVVNQLSALLRIADALDRTHYRVVNDMEFACDQVSGVLLVNLVLITPDCSFEIAKANDKKDLFEIEFGMEIKFKILK